MAVTNFSPLLGFALPTTGDLSGTWGTTVNTSITNLIDSAVAGTTTLSADADVTLTTTNGAANQARNAVILWTASNGATTRNITAPAQSKAYIVINAGTGSIVIRGSGPTTGVTVAAGFKALVAWNGSDFVKVASSLISLTTDVTGTLPIANGGTGTTATAFTNLTTNVTGILPVANGGTGTTATAFTNLTTNVTGILPVVNGGTGVATSTGTGSVVLSASPTFTGVPAAPTAVINTNTTQIATTAFVIAQVSAISSGVVSFSAGSTGLTPNTASTGVVTLSGVLNTASGGTGNANGTVAKLATTNFSIEESGGNLIFKYGATTVASMTSAGVFTTLSDINSNGTP
jgi:hypothetical protein